MLDDWYRLKRFVQLTHQVSILLHSGKPLLDVLDILRPARSKLSYLKSYDRMVDQLSIGDDFARSLATLLPPYMRYACSIFYGFSDYQVMISHSYDFYSQSVSSVQFLMKRLLYPFLLLLTLVLLLIVFFQFIYPQYHVFLSEFHDGKWIVYIDGAFAFFKICSGCTGGIIFYVMIRHRVSFKRWLTSWLFNRSSHDILCLIVLSMSHNRPLKEVLSLELFDPLANGAKKYEQFLELFIELGSFTCAWNTCFPYKGFYEDWFLSIESDADIVTQLTIFCKEYSQYRRFRQLRVLSLITPLLLVLVGFLILGIIGLLYLPIVMMSEQL